MSTPKTRKSMLHVAMLTAATLLLLCAPVPYDDTNADPRTKCGTSFTFYSDATYTTVVGSWTYSPEACGCTFTSSGSVTPFRIVQDNPYC